VLPNTGHALIIWMDILLYDYANVMLTNIRVTKQSNHGHPVRIVNVSSKMHELSPGIDVRDPHFAKGRAYSSLAAYNRSKLAQVAPPSPH